MAVSLSFRSQVLGVCFFSWVLLHVFAVAPGLVPSVIRRNPNSDHSSAANSRRVAPQILRGHLRRREVGEASSHIRKRHLLHRRAGDEDEKRERGSEPKSGRQSTSRSTSVSSLDTGSIHEEGPPGLLVPPQRQISAFQQSLPKSPASVGTPRPRTTPRVGTPKLENLRSRLGSQSPTHRYYDEEPSRHEPAAKHEWLDATSTHAWLRMKSNDPFKKISKHDFTQRFRQQAETLGLLGSVHRMSGKEIKALDAGIKSSRHSPSSVERYLQDGLGHYVTSIRPDVLTKHGVTANLESVKKENEEFHRQLYLQGHIRR